MLAVVALPDHPYYVWQMLVQAAQFERFGQDVVYLTCGQAASRSPLLDAVAAAVPFEVTYWQGGFTYAPASKPWLMARLLEARPHLACEPLLYLDPDVVLAGLDAPWPDAWAGSDTDSYTGPGYLESKGALEVLCDLTGCQIDAARNVRGFGAQYVVQSAPAAFWDEVAATSQQAYDVMAAHPERFWPAGDEHPVQAWCAEMYVTQVLAIRDGHQPHVDESMRFLWANGSADAWDEHRFFHDAGVQAENGRDFCKLTHQASPFGKALTVDPTSASSRYVDLIHLTERTHPDVVRHFPQEVTHG